MSGLLGAGEEPGRACAVGAASGLADDSATVVDWLCGQIREQSQAPSARVSRGSPGMSFNLEVLRERGRQDAIEWQREVARSDFVVVDARLAERGEGSLTGEQIKSIEAIRGVYLELPELYADVFLVIDARSSVDEIVETCLSDLDSSTAPVLYNANEGKMRCGS